MENSRRKQAFNPYLPSYEYIPDGEPHVFGDRIYIFGSHDRFNGGDYCLNDYVCWSADVKDLADWRYEGVIYQKMQDPRNQDRKRAGDYELPKWTIAHRKQAAKGGADDLNPYEVHAMWAPDVAQGRDGRYYLYYCLDYFPEMGVAVCDTPAGQYEFLGYVRHEDGTPLACKPEDPWQFDPAVLVEENGIYLYSGSAPMRARRGGSDGQSGPLVMELCDDMLTLKTKPHRFLPTVYSSTGTGFEGHEFFEGSSMRKWNERYYFIYSSVRSQELCYAYSKYPDRDFIYGGTLVDIADVGLDGRTYRNGVNVTGNTHGSIERIGDRFYVFYHRQTNRTDFSRQGCAEEIFMDDTGAFAQVEVTSCGLNGGPLLGSGYYPARICCHLRSRWGIIYSNVTAMGMRYPFLRQDCPDISPDSAQAAKDEKIPVQYVANLKHKSTVGYKYFMFTDENRITLTLRGRAKGEVLVYQDLEKKPCGRIFLGIQGQQWTRCSGNVALTPGKSALYFQFRGRGAWDLQGFEIR